MSQEEADRPSVVDLDVGDVTSIYAFHERLAERLHFPDFYGHNWDAFWDTITGLVQLPRRLVVYGWPHVAGRWPEDADKMLACLRELDQQFPSWGCQVELRPAADRPAT